ncbi:MAG: STAS domain-containing protein [Armatimonadota bacterium]
MAGISKFSVELQEQDGIPIVRAQGEVDLNTVGEFQSVLHEGLARDGTVLVADLRDLFYIDSAGLSALIATYRSLAARNGKLYIIVNPDRPGVARVLEITRLDSFMEVRNSLEDALREIKAWR